MRFLLRTAIGQGRIEEEIALLEELVPGMLDVTTANSRPKYRNAQIAAFDAWYVALPRDEFLDRLDEILRILSESGIEPMDDPRTAVAVHAFRGEYEQAADIALERYFTQPVAMNLDWRRTFSQGQFAPLLEDERIQAEIARWEQEEEALRDQVRDLLSDLSS